MKKESKGMRFLIGLLGILVIAFIYGIFTAAGGVGTLSSLFSFMMISIICTGGIALVIWIPLLLLVGGVLGTIIVKVYALISGKPKLAEVAVSAPALSNKELAIIGYIVKCRQSGISDDVTRLNLKNGGWNDIDIDNAFKKSGF